MTIITVDSLGVRLAPLVLLPSQIGRPYRVAGTEMYCCCVPPGPGVGYAIRMKIMCLWREASSGLIPGAPGLGRT